MEIGLVSCRRRRRTRRRRRGTLRTPALFRKARRYVEVNHGVWYVLSAKYNVLDPDGSPIEPYDETLNNAGVEERREWSRAVVGQLRGRDLLAEGNTLVIHAGKAYYEEFLPLLPTRCLSTSRFQPRDYGWARRCHGTMNECRFYAADWLGVVWSNWGLSIPAATTYPRSPLTRGSTAFATPPAPVWSISARLGAASVVESVRSPTGRSPRKCLIAIHRYGKIRSAL